MNLTTEENRAIEQLREISNLDGTVKWGWELLENKSRPTKRLRSLTRGDSIVRQLHPKTPVRLHLQEIQLGKCLEKPLKLPPIQRPRLSKPQTAKANYNGLILGLNYVAFERRLTRLGKENI